MCDVLRELFILYVLKKYISNMDCSLDRYEDTFKLITTHSRKVYFLTRLTILRQYLLHIMISYNHRLTKLLALLI